MFVISGSCVWLRLHSFSNNDFNKYSWVRLQVVNNADVGSE